MHISEFQREIERTYYERDSARGMGGTFQWFIEEVGELASALRDGTDEERAEEFADVMAWLCTLASISGIELEKAAQRFVGGCPYCRAVPCVCPEKP